MKWLGNATEVRQHKKVAKRSQWVLTHNIRASSKRTLVVLQIERSRSLSTVLLPRFTHRDFQWNFEGVWSFVLEGFLLLKPLFAGTLYVWSFRAKTFKALEELGSQSRRHVEDDLPGGCDATAVGGSSGGRERAWRRRRCPSSSPRTSWRWLTIEMKIDLTTLNN